jgi:hypothetical protein
MSREALTTVARRKTVSAPKPEDLGEQLLPVTQAAPQQPASPHGSAGAWEPSIKLADDAPDVAAPMTPNVFWPCPAV